MGDVGQGAVRWAEVGLRREGTAHTREIQQGRGWVGVDSRREGPVLLCSLGSFGRCQFSCHVAIAALFLACRDAWVEGVQKLLTSSAIDPNLGRVQVRSSVSESSACNI